MKDILKAAEALQGVVHKTPIDYSRNFSTMAGSEVFLKKENEQKTGSFKIRGAYNKILSLTDEEKKRGVVACSAGNHAQGVALSASLAGIQATIVMPKAAPLVKVSATRDYGADVILHGSIYDEASDHAKQLAKEKGYVFVHPFEDFHVIAGQGTVALEIWEDFSDFDTFIVPVGGGGLISGVATVVKARNPKCRVIGVQAARSPGMATAFQQKQIIKDLKTSPTIADGIAVKHPSPMMYEQYISRLIDEMVTVTEDDIAEAIVLLMERTKTVVEGAGAVGVAALLTGKLQLGAKTCVVLSGGNIDMNLIEKIIDRGLSRHGRIVRLSVIVPDVPGNLNRLTALLASLGANIMHVGHDRIDEGLGLMETRIDFTLEVNGFEQVKHIKETLYSSGIRILEKQ